MVHVLSIDELLPHRPAGEKRGSVSCLDVQISFWEDSSLDSTHMSLDGVGFGEGEERFPSMISLKLLFPTFLASWGRKKKKSASCISVLRSLLLDYF